MHVSTIYLGILDVSYLSMHAALSFSMYSKIPLWKLWLLCFGLRNVAGYSAVPRWGQAVAVINDTLFVHGGKTDQNNAYSYNSAPTSNDLLCLSLSTPFDTSSPPWELISGSSDLSSPQGPALAWHTLSPINSSTLLLFGGDPGPNSPTVIDTLADSAVLLNVFDYLVPIWTTESQSWANEPMRRIHHSACSSDGKIWLVGGEKDDGSNNALSDHYVFDPTVPSFTQLPSTNGPPDLYGHACVVLPDGLMLIFGGYSQSLATSIPFTTIWAIDTTQANPTWISISIAGSSFPSPRRAFAVVILDDGKILIQGGADASLQNVFSDAWILDTTQSPMVWSVLEELSLFGPRYDHFAVATGPQVILGSGYGPSGEAPGDLSIYNTASSTFVSSFTPVTATPTNTFSPPPYTETIAGTPGVTPRPSSELHTSSTHATAISSHTNTDTQVVYPTPTQTENLRSGNGDATTTIAVVTTFGVLALIGGMVATFYYFRHHRHYANGDRFHLLDAEGSEDGDNPHMANVIPMAGVQQEKFRSGPSGWFPMSSKEVNDHAGAGHGLTDSGQQRRDMFADEDTRNFGANSFYTVSRDGSSWSLQSMGAAIGSVGTGIRGMLSRENSGGGRSIHRETPSDPFSDGAALIQDGEFNPYDLAVVKPHVRREASHASMAQPYHDPFVNHPIKEVEHGYQYLNVDDTDVDESTSFTRSLSSQIKQPPTVGIHPLPPLTEQTSRTTTDPASLSDHRSSPEIDSNPNSSFSSSEYNNQRRSSIINTNPKPNSLIRRSDSWWARFAKTSLLDRKPSDGGKMSPRTMEFRDPNPAPRLLTIQEASMHSLSPDSVDSQQPQPVQHRASHRKSISSVHTAKTADSEAIERIGTMDVIQRIGTNHSHQTTSSTGRDTPERDSWFIPSPLSVVASSGRSGETLSRSEDEMIVDSPTEMVAPDILGEASTSDVSAKSSSKPLRPVVGGNVMSRIQAFERRISQDSEGIASPRSPLSPGARNTKKTEEHPSKNRVTINYGLAPRPSLFVANPDHTRYPSSEP